MRKDVKRVAIYIRVSTYEQAQEGYSIDEQKERLVQYCKAMGWVVSEIYIDHGFSGANLERPGLQKLIAEIKAYDSVLVYKLDRISRSQKDTMYLIEDVFLKNDVDFVSMSESFDTSTPFGRAAVGLLATFAQLERENIKERMTMGMKGRARKGYWKGTSRPPIGYDYKDGNLEVNDYEAMQIRELFTIAANGIPNMPYNVKNMARYLSQKYSNKYGNWTDSTGITYTIQNKVYIGMVKYKDEYFPGNHMPLIDNELFDKANNRLNAYLSSFGEHSTYTKYMLSGLTVCGICGRPYYRRNSQTKIGGIKKEYGYYSCQGRKADIPVKCQSKIYRQEELEQEVINQIESLKYRDFSTGNGKNDTASLLQEMKQIDSRQERLIDLYSLGSVSREQIDDKIRELNHQREKVKVLLSAQNTLKSEEIIKMSTCIRNVDYATQCDIAGMLIEKVVVEGENIRVYWNF